MFLVGLTGGIAAGKSTVSELWESLGATVVDADVLAREVVDLGSEGLARIVENFGPQILNVDGTLNRSELGSIVFGIDEKRRILERIVHPLIKDLALKRIAEANTTVVVYVIPLLVETNSDLAFDFVVTVEAPEGKQIERLVSSRGMTSVEASNRIRTQASAAQRANVADAILNSNQDLPLLLKDAKKLFSDIQKLAQAKEDSE